MVRVNPFIIKSKETRETKEGSDEQGNFACQI